MRIHFSTISILTVLTLFFSHPSFTQNPTTTDLEKRISSIEKRITILENQLSELRWELAKLKSQLKEQPSKTTTRKTKLATPYTWCVNVGGKVPPWRAR
jgi:septal ring factor EnvC (AmiA/AmiB activator)